jgi:hypothetical protein
MTNSITATFSEQGHIDKMCDNVVTILKAHDELSEWTGDRIVRSSGFTGIEGMAVPHITVSALDIESVLQPSKKEEDVVPIGILIAHEEFFDEIPEGGSSIATVVQVIKTILFGDVHLTGGTGTQANYTAERLNDVRVTNLDRAVLEDDSVASLVTIRAEYKVRLSLENQERFRC